MAEFGQDLRADVKEMLNDYGIYQVQREKELGGGAKYIFVYSPRTVCK